MFYDNLAVYEGFGGVVLAKEEGVHISNALGTANKNVILQNHGYVIYSSADVIKICLRKSQNFDLWGYS